MKCNLIYSLQEKMVAEGKEQAKRTLQKLFPEVDVTETIEESEWITVFEQKVHAFISQKEAAAGSVSRCSLFT